MQLQMYIANIFFTSIEFSFDGIYSVDERMDYVQGLTNNLCQKYQYEIYLKGGNPQFFYTAPSKLKFIDVSDFEVKQLTAKATANAITKNVA